MTTTKPQKDKPFAPAPKLVPRPTAASAARAAINATNRNLITNTISLAQRTPPTKGPTSPNLKRRSSVCQRNLPGTETKSDQKADTPIDTKLNAKIIEEFTGNDTKINTEMNDDKTESIEEPTQQEEPAVTITSESEDLREEPQQDAIPPADIDKLNENEKEGLTTETDIPQSEDKPELVETEKLNVTFDSTTVSSLPPVSQPQSRAGSRPNTPKSPGRMRPSAGGTRPSTPNSSLGPQRHTTPVSRPTTPQRHHGRPSNSQPVPTTYVQPNNFTTSVYISTVTDNSPFLDDGDVKLAYSAKQKQFQQMKKELDLKQQAVLEVFDGLRALRERMSSEGLSGSGEGQVQELLVFNVADWPAEEVAQLYRDAAAACNTDGAVEFIESIPVDECTLNEVEAKVVNIPSQFAELCLQSFTARQELIDWVKELLLCSNYQLESGEGEALQRIAEYNTQGSELCDALRELKNRADSAVDTVSYVSKRVWRDQIALIGVGQSLVRDIARLKQDLESQATIINELRQCRSGTDSGILESIRQELEEERAAKHSLKDKLAQSENQLRQTRNRVAKMDRQLREAEASITTLTGTVKILEDQSRQREAQVEARARKLRESLKTGEVASGHLTQQRDALQNEVLELKDQIEKLTAQHKATVKDFKVQLKETKAALEEQIQLNEKTEQELLAEKDATIAEYKSTIDQLKGKIKELENKAEQNDKQNLPTAREMELLAELQATKVALRLVEDEVVVCKREKVRFLESLTKIADSDNKVGMQQKLAAELLSKEEIIGKMQVQMRELTKNDKLLEQKIAQYEQYVTDLQRHNTGLNNMEDSSETNYQELQKEILNLRMQLCESVHRNEELSETLAQKEQQLDQQDKTSRAQARVIKVREELINMLKNKETEQSRELSALQQDLEHRMKIVDEVNKQIAAKAVEIQELFATLESKQQQIHRLEKIVLALEEQQRRAQAQRTRHEEKIAALEHELAAGGYRRERKFLFF